MKLSRRLYLLLGGIGVILIIAAVILYISNLEQVSKRNQLQSDISQAQSTLAKSSQEKSTLASQTPLLEAQLIESKSSLAGTGFLSSAESIEYDAILFSLAGTHSLHVNNLSASSLEDREENRIKYQSATFTINVEGEFPGTPFKTADDSKQYIDTNVNNILAFVNAIVTGNEFRTASIHSVSINFPAPLTEAKVAQLPLTDEIISQLTEAETEDKTNDEIGVLAAAKLAAQTPEEIQGLWEKTGFERPSAVITFEIWMYQAQ